jgi:hypothetical protein
MRVYISSYKAILSSTIPSVSHEVADKPKQTLEYRSSLSAAAAPEKKLLAVLLHGTLISRLLLMMLSAYVV